jgi:hypothetical protein
MKEQSQKANMMNGFKKKLFLLSEWMDYFYEWMTKKITLNSITFTPLDLNFFVK